MKTLFPSNTVKPAPEDLRAQQDIDTLARTVWGEARGEGSIGMQAVAAVILNRAAIAKRFRNFWWGRDIQEICRKPYQFSCWNKDDPNFKKLLRVDERDLYFATALRVAQRALSGVLPDPTAGATHYHAAGVAPHWAAGEKPCAVIGRHIFYRLDA